MSSLASHPLFAFLRESQSTSQPMQPTAGPSRALPGPRIAARSSPPVNHVAELESFRGSLEELTAKVDALDKAERKRSLEVQGRLDDISEQLAAFEPSTSSAATKSVDSSKALKDIKAGLEALSASLIDGRSSSRDAGEAKAVLRELERLQRTVEAMQQAQTQGERSRDDRLLHLERETARLNATLTPLTTLAPLLQSFLASRISQINSAGVEVQMAELVEGHPPVSTAASCRASAELLLSTALPDSEVDPFLQPPEDLSFAPEIEYRDPRTYRKPTTRKPTLIEAGQAMSSLRRKATKRARCHTSTRADPRGTKRSRPTLLDPQEPEDAEAAREPDHGFRGSVEAEQTDQVPTMPRKSRRRLL